MSSLSSQLGALPHQPLKVTFVGAHGTGKTTLVKALSEHITSLDIRCSITPEVPRIVCENARDLAFFRRGNNSLLKQTVLLVGQPVYENGPSAGNESVLLCDRAILDHWAYTRHSFMQELESENVLQPLDNLVAKHCSSYNFIFYVPIEFAPQDDGTRESDHDFQRAIDEEIRELLKTYNLTYHTINGTVPERVTQVMSVLNS
jgi:thymidylate kinase